MSGELTDEQIDEILREKDRARLRSWYKLNRERKVAAMKARYHANREAICSSFRERYHSDPAFRAKRLLQAKIARVKREDRA